VATLVEERTPAGRDVAVVEQSIPTVVSAAWELELVIAGGVTFALFQLPGSLETLRLWIEPRVTPGVLAALFIAYVYTKVMVYVLIGAFVLNLTARAYWVGLVGLHSVFPRGIDWNRTRLGPALNEAYRARLSSLPAVIARVDNFASVVFSFGFLIVVVCLFSLLACSILGAIGWGIDAAFFAGRNGLAVFDGVLLAFALPLMALAAVDRRFGARWPAESPAGRRLRRLTRIASYVNGTSLFGPIYYTLATNLRRGVMRALFYATFFGALLVAIGELLWRMGAVAPGSPRYVPDDDAIRTMRADFYESMRTRESSTRVPTIQSDVIDGPYVRLFIPYIAERHDPALAENCRGAAPLRPSHLHLTAGVPDAEREGAERTADAVLSCLQRMHVISVDGVIQRDVTLRFYTHPVTGRLGVITYIPTASLAPGAHVLHVMPPPRPPGSTSRGLLVPFEITFWK
jgi:hypothetical protein